MEEIYKNQIYALNVNHSGNINSNNCNDNTTFKNDINNLINISIKNDIKDNSMINLNSNHILTILDNKILNVWNCIAYFMKKNIIGILLQNKANPTIKDKFNKIALEDTRDKNFFKLIKNFII